MVFMVKVHKVFDTYDSTFGIFIGKYGNNNKTLNDLQNILAKAQPLSPMRKDLWSFADRIRAINFNVINKNIFHIK